MRRRGVEETYGVHPEVKWPNDLVVDRKKIAGILIETKTSGPKLEYAIVGVGLNVNLAPKELPTGASSIFLVRKKKFGLEKTVDSILAIFEDHYETLRDEKLVVANWWEHCAHRMKPVVVDADKSRISGKCVGINPDGSIIIQTDHGRVTVSDGTLRLDV